VAYLSSRIYGGYAATPLNPEPHAYEGAFAVKWTIASQIAGDAELNYDPDKGAVRSPWIAYVSEMVPVSCRGGFPVRPGGERR
jgi:hypothetical protein